MKKINVFILSAFLLAAFCSPVNATIIYVRAAATGANTGLNWTDAFTDLQTGIGATLPGDTIWVAAGVYKPTTTTTRTISFALPDGVKLLGGFNGTETLVSQRNFVTNVTNLSGDIGVTGNSTDNSYHVVTTIGVSNNTLLDGFRILSGNANATASNNRAGGAIYNSTGNPVIRNCTLQNNNASYGGAIEQVTSGTMNVIDCKIISNTSTGNTTNWGGGAAEVVGGTLNLTGCTITQNSAFYGGAICMTGGTTNINRCDISGNTASETGGAIFGYQYDFYLTITNSLIVGNIANNGARSAIYCASTPSHNHRMINCTVADNMAPAISPSSTYFGSTSEIDNSIFSGNSEALQISVTNASVNNCWVAPINGNPFFIAPGNYSLAPFTSSSYNYHVAAFSPVIDYGNGSYILPGFNTDLDNTSRIQGPAPDCGCYENTGCTFNLLITSTDSSAICSGNSTTLNASAGTSFLWGNSTTTSSLTTNTAGTYTLEADSAGCYGSASYTLSLINASVAINGPAGFCPGDSISLVASGANIGSYNWNNGDTTSSIVVSTAGTYSVAITTTEGCTSNSSTNITAYSAPNPIITFNTPTISTTATFATYQWLLNGSPIGGATSQQYTVLQNGDYSVIVTNVNGCSDTSALYNITNLGTGALASNSFHSFPNPCTNELTISGTAEELCNALVVVYDAQGRIVTTKVFAGSSTQIIVDMSELQSGMYIICVNGNDGTARFPVNKQ